VDNAAGAYGGERVYGRAGAVRDKNEPDDAGIRQQVATSSPSVCHWQRKTMQLTTRRPPWPLQRKHSPNGRATTPQRPQLPR
jgi:hypothetical protein